MSDSDAKEKEQLQTKDSFQPRQIFTNTAQIGVDLAARKASFVSSVKMSANGLPFDPYTVALGKTFIDNTVDQQYILQPREEISKLSKYCL